MPSNAILRHRAARFTRLLAQNHMHATAGVVAVFATPFGAASTLPPSPDVPGLDRLAEATHEARVRARCATLALGISDWGPLEAMLAGTPLEVELAALRTSPVFAVFPSARRVRWALLPGEAQILCAALQRAGLVTEIRRSATSTDLVLRAPLGTLFWPQASLTHWLAQTPAEAWLPRWTWLAELAPDYVADHLLGLGARPDGMAMPRQALRPLLQRGTGVTRRRAAAVAVTLAAARGSRRGGRPPVR